MPRLSPTVSSLTVTIVGVLPAYLTGALAVQMSAELEYGPSVLGALVAGAFFASAAGSFAGGWLADHLGADRVMRAACWLAAVPLLAVGAAVHSVPALAVALVVGGLSNGIGQPASNALLSRAVPTDRQGAAFGAKQAAIPGAVLLGGLAVPGIALTVGWRWTFVLAALLAVVVSLLVPAEPPRAAGGDGSVPTARIRIPPLLLLAVAGVFGAAAGNALAAFLVDSAVTGGYAPGTAGLLASLGSGAGVLTRLVMGVLADRRGRRHLQVVALMMAAGTLGFAGLASGPGWYVPAAVVGYAAGWGWAGLYHFGIARLHPGAAGRATGVTQTGVALGGALGPFVFGFIVEATSYSTAWLTAAGWLLVAAVATATGRVMLRRSIDPEVLAAVRAGTRRGAPALDAYGTISGSSRQGDEK